MFHVGEIGHCSPFGSVFWIFELGLEIDICEVLACFRPQRWDVEAIQCLMGSSGGHMGEGFPMAALDS